MPLTVVLAVGVDSFQLAADHASWKSAGYSVVSTHSIRDAIAYFHAGDFDLVLLGNSIPIEDLERLTFLIRASGSRTPVVCIANHSGEIHSFADASLEWDSNALLAEMGKVVARESRAREVSANLDASAA